MTSRSDTRVHFLYMKSVLEVFRKLDGLSILVGMLLGAAVGLVLFSLLVPNGKTVIGFYHHKMGEVRNGKQHTEMVKLYGDDAGDMGHMMNMSNGQNSSNPYMMSDVVSEEQFLHDMVLHHEAALIMARQVLALPSLHSEVRNLANAILNTQTKEITDMKAWTKNWGY